MPVPRLDADEACTRFRPDSELRQAVELYCNSRCPGRGVDDRAALQSVPDQCSRFEEILSQDEVSSIEWRLVSRARQKTSDGTTDPCRFVMGESDRVPCPAFCSGHWPAKGRVEAEGDREDFTAFVERVSRDRKACAVKPVGYLEAKREGVS
jgi:hypothetical protein